MRLDKALSLAGYTRSEAKTLIARGRVCVSGEVTVESDTDCRNADLGFVLREPGKYPAGYGEGATQDWTKTDRDN